MRHVTKGIWMALLMVQVFGLSAANPPIQLTFTFSQPTCFGYTNGTATVTPSNGTAPYSYAWSNAQGGQTTYGIGSGTYFVTVTDANGEVATGSVFVTQPDQLVAAITATDVDCDGPPVTLTASGTGGTGSYTYSWTNGANTSSIIANTQGNYGVTLTDANGCIDNEVIQVYPGSEFFVGYQYVTPDCSGIPNGSITAVTFGNFPPFTYHWSNGATTATNANIPSGMYDLTITNAQNCTFTDHVTLEGPNQFSVDVVATDIPCAIFTNGGAVVANATGGFPPYTYTWNNNAGNVSGQMNIPAGYYAVTVTDQNGCTTIDGDTVNVPPLLTVELVSVSPSCGDSTGCATVQGVGGVPPYTYTWPVLGVTGQTVCGLAPGSYYVCVFDALHCQHDFTVNIDSISNLNVTLITTKAECQGVDDGTATAIVNPPGGNYTYQWNIQNSPPVAQLNGIPAGTVVCVTVTDMVTGCSDTACAVIGTHTIVNVQVTDTTDVVCVGDSTGMASALASGGTAPYNYVWTFPDSSQVSGNTISNLPAGAYSVWVTDSNGCTALSVADIGALSNPVADFTLNTLACVDNQVTVQFVDASTDNLSPIVSWHWEFVWSNGSSQSDLQNPPPLQFTQNENGTATLVITSAAGCQDSVQLPFNVTGIPTFTINAPNPTVDCQNGPIPITVTGTPGQTYEWSPMTDLVFVNGDPTNVIADPDQTTTYTLTVNGGGCTGTAQVTVIRVTPLDLSLQDASIVTCDSLATLQASINTTATVNWYNQQGQLLGTGLSLTVPAGPLETYFAVATDAYGCADTAAATVQGGGIDVQIAVLGQDSLCENTPFVLQAINLNPGQILTYHWTAQPPTITFSPNANVANPVATAPAGSYVVSLHLTNQYDCVADISIPLEVQPGASIDGQIDADLCHGLTVNFTNSSNVLGTWHFGTGDTSTDPNPTYTYPQAGDYIVQFVPTQGCVQTFTDTITVSDSNTLNAAIGAAQLSCLHDAVVQFTDQSTGNPVSWQWNFQPGNQNSSEQNPLITFANQGTVTATLIVENAIGCTDTASLSLDVVVIDDEVSNPGNFCPGESVELNPDGNAVYTYQWSSNPVDPTLVSNSPNPVVTPTVTTMYYVTITNGDCSVVDSALAIVEPAPNAAFSFSQINCSGNATFQFTDQSTGNPTNWHWTFPGGNPAVSTQANPTITFNQEGTVTVTLVVTSGGGCADTTTQTLDIGFIDDEIGDLVGVCEGGALPLNTDGNPNYTYVWTSVPVDPNLSGNSPNPVVSPSGTTTYYVTITNGACVVTDSAVVTVLPQPNAAFIAILQNCVGEATVQFTDQSTGNPTSWNWTFPGGTPATSTEQNPTVTFNQDGTVTVTLVVGNGVCSDTTTLDVQINILNDDISDPAAICAGTSVPLNPDGNPNYTYVWTSVPVDPNLSGNSPNPVVSPTGTTTYYVTITNGACVVTDSAVVTVLPQPNAAFIAILQNCVGEATVQFTDQSTGNPTSWNWTFPGGTPATSTEQNPTVTFNQDGTVTVTLVVGNGVCSDTTTLDVQINILDDDISDPAAICAGTSVPLNPDGNPNYTYVWTSVPVDPNLSGSSPNPVVSPSGTTTYYVTITNGACVVTDSAVVTVLSTPTAIAGVAQTNCLGAATIQFTGNQSLGNPTSWHWTFTPGNQTSNEQNPELTFNQDGSVTGTLIVTNASGCSDTTEVSIVYYLIDDTEINSGNYCPGDSVQLNPVFNNNYNYTWSANPADPDLVANLPNPVVSPDVQTSYFVTIVNGTCIFKDTALVVPVPGANIELPNDIFTCNADPLNLTVVNSNATQFQWSTSPDFNPVLSNNDTIVVVPGPGQYYYAQAINEFNCTAVDSVWVQNADVAIDYEPAQRDVCLGSSAELTITNLNPDDNLTYHWTPNLPGTPNPTVTPTDTTTYMAIVTNQAGCVDTAVFQVNVIQVAAEAQITGKASICPGDSTLLVVIPSGGTDYSYEWEPAGSLSNPFDSTTYAFPVETTTYIVTVTATNTNCTATSEVTVAVMSGECVEPYIFVPKAFTPNNDGNNDFFRVRGVNIKEIYFVVFDRWGEKVYETNDPAHTGWDGTFNGRELTPDAYGWYLRATCGNGAVYESKGNVTLLK